MARLHTGNENPLTDYAARREAVAALVEAARLAVDGPQRLTEGALHRRKQRTELMARLLEHDEIELAEVLAGCGHLIRLTCDRCSETHQVETGCRKRWCPVCARALAAKQVDRYKAVVERMQWPLFTVFTATNKTEIAPMVKGMRKAWKAFRRTKWWNSLEVAGGICRMEITNKDAGWHVHLHALIDCEWLAVHAGRPQRGDSPDTVRRRCQAAQAELQDQWSKCLGAAGQLVYVCRARKGSVIEALKYAVKPDDMLRMSVNPAELIRAMKCTRMMTSWGSCYGLARKLAEEEAEEEDRSPTCTRCKGRDWSLDKSSIQRSAARRIRERLESRERDENGEVSRAAAQRVSQRMVAWHKGEAPPIRGPWSGDHRQQSQAAQA